MLLQQKNTSLKHSKLQPPLPSLLCLLHLWGTRPGGMQPCRHHPLIIFIFDDIYFFNISMLMSRGNLQLPKCLHEQSKINLVSVKKQNLGHMVWDSPNSTITVFSSCRFFIPLQTKRVREVANLTERKNPHTPVYE